MICILFCFPLNYKILDIVTEIISEMLEQHLSSSYLWNTGEIFHLPLFLPFLTHLKFK